MPEACRGNIPHVMPFHLGLFVVEANFQIISIANRNSKTEEK